MGDARSRWILVGILLGVGCFSESPSEATCRDGGVGCPCGVGCEAGLVCAADIELCIPENCVPGSELCTCNEGQCLSGLECTEGLCRMPDGTGSNSTADDVASTQGTVTDPSTTGMDTADPTTSMTADPSFTSDPSLTDTVTTDSATTDPSMTDSAPTTDDMTASDATESETGMIDGAPCRACIIQENDMTGNCGMELTGCGGNFSCMELASCVSDCLVADDPSCIAGCCAEHPDGVDAYAPLAECHTLYCGQMCTGFELHCGG